MFLLQSDFSRHSLLDLLGPAELRVFIKFHARISPNHTKHLPIYIIVLIQSSGPTPSGSLKVDSGRLNLPMSLHPSLNAHLIYLDYI
jgi:predicted class III extradiol MEMO1 family dioxygenase